MGLLHKGVSLMPGIYSDKSETLLNTLRVSDRLSIDRVCLLSACHEVYTAFLCCPINYPQLVNRKRKGCVRGRVEREEAGGEKVPNCRLKLPDGTGWLQMSADGRNSCICGVRRLGTAVASCRQSY